MKSSIRHVSAFALVGALLTSPAMLTIGSADETRCDQLRARATALHQERAGMSDTEDFLALAVGMETLDVALDEVAREYARLSCGRPTSDSTTAE